MANRALPSFFFALPCIFVVTLLMSRRPKNPFSPMLAISPIIYYAKSFYSERYLMALRGKAARGRG